MVTNNQFKPDEPIITYPEAKKLFQARGLEEQFRKYNYAAKNKFIHKYLHLMQHGLCALCHKKIADPVCGGVIHHQTYAHYCSCEHPAIRMYVPREADINYRTLPNCELCYYTTPEAADQCLSGLVLVHDKCHQQIHGK